RVTLWMEPVYEYLMVYTPDAIPDRARRRRSIAIEPMTCAPNAFRRGEGLIILQPGEARSSDWVVLRELRRPRRYHRMADRLRTLSRSDTIKSRHHAAVREGAAGVREALRP